MKSKRQIEELIKEYSKTQCALEGKWGIDPFGFENTVEVWKELSYRKLALIWVLEDCKY